MTLGAATEVYGRRMRSLLALALVIAGAVGTSGCSAHSPDLTCPGARTTAFRDGSTGMRTPRAALGSDLDGVHDVVEEDRRSAALPTVTYRGYDEDGDLVRVVVVEGTDQGWIASRVDTCE